MIKYLVMGIKGILKSDKCEMCGCKLEVLSWKFCDPCGQERKKLADRVHQRENKEEIAKRAQQYYIDKKIYKKWKESAPVVSPLAYREVSLLELYALEFKCQKDKALGSEILMHDENLHVIGYYK